MKDLFEIRQSVYLESARHLTQLPKSHPCSNMHGHSFKVTFVVRGTLNEAGWVCDYYDILKAFEPLKQQLDHKVLNQVPGLENPTTEILTRWIFENLKKTLPYLHQVLVSETPSTECRYPLA